MAPNISSPGGNPSPDRRSSPQAEPGLRGTPFGPVCQAPEVCFPHPIPCAGPGVPCHQSGWAVTASPRLSTRGRREPVHWWLRGLRDGREGAWLLTGGARGGRGARMDTRVCTRVCGRVLVHTDTRAWGGGRGHLSPESGGPGQPGRRGCEQSPCGPGQEGQPQVGGLAWCPLCVASGRAPASLGLSPQVLPLPSRGSDRLTGKTGRLGPRAPMSVSGARLGSLVLPPRSCRTPQPSVLCEGAGGRVR